jgi:hypothetical protein
MLQTPSYQLEEKCILNNANSQASMDTVVGREMQAESFKLQASMDILIGREIHKI